MDHATKFHLDNAIVCIIIAGSYQFARNIAFLPTTTGGVLNPAIALGNIMVSVIDSVGGLTWIWIYVGFPFAGALVANILA